MPEEFAFGAVRPATASDDCATAERVLGPWWEPQARPDEEVGKATRFRKQVPEGVDCCGFLLLGGFFFFFIVSETRFGVRSIRKDLKEPPVRSLGDFVVSFALFLVFEVLVFGVGLELWK